MVEDSDRPIRPLCESSLTHLGLDRDLEIVAAALGKIFPLPPSASDERMNSLLRLLEDIDQR
ncbi:MAG: hypothetical protein ABW110_23100 [Steroidobacteraceae bacterium]